MKVSITTLGCKSNQYDSAAIEDLAKIRYRRKGIKAKVTPLENNKVTGYAIDR